MTVVRYPAYDPIMRARALVLPLTLVLLTGCGGASESQNPASTGNGEVGDVATEATPPTLGVVESVDDVQVAYSEAGGDCSGPLENRNNVVTALSSGVCPGSGSVLTAYIDHDDAKDAVDQMFSLSDRIGFEVIIGDNWVVNPSGDDTEIISDLAETMGGQVLSKPAAD